MNIGFFSFLVFLGAVMSMISAMQVAEGLLDARLLLTFPTFWFTVSPAQIKM